MTTACAKPATSFASPRSSSAPPTAPDDGRRAAGFPGARHRGHCPGRMCEPAATPAAGQSGCSARGDPAADASEGRETHGWAIDIFAAFEALEILPTTEHICGVLAVADQESNFQVDPVVPGLPDIARREMEARAAAITFPKSSWLQRSKFIRRTD